MSFFDGPFGEMEMHLGRPDITDPLDLDHGTAARLLRGEMAADDAPPSYRRVAVLLTALNADAIAAELSGEGKAVDAISRRIAAAASSTKTGSTKMTMKRRLQLVGVTAIGGLTLLSGLGVAGALPGAAQGVAADVLGTVGVSVPSPNDHSDGHADERGRSADHVDGAADAGAAATSADADTGKGSGVSAAATDSSTTGLDKGAAVSSEASNGQSQAGQHGVADASPDAPVAAAPPGTPPVETPPVPAPPVPTPPVSGVPGSPPPVSVPPVPTPPVSIPPVSIPSHP
jgi:hypothetical protein